MRAQVVAELARDDDAVLYYGTSPNLDGAEVTPTVSPVNKVAKFTITGLAPNTQYYCAVAIEGVLYLSKKASFVTPSSGAHSFTFAAASCMSTESRALVFDNIRTSGAEFFIQMGDIHYENIATNDPALYRDAWHLALKPPRVKSLFQSMPVYHMWDDHDYGANNSDSTSPSKAAAISTFRAQVPVTEFVDGSAVYYSFVRGRVRFVLTDLRSERTPNAATDDSSKKMMSDTQLTWFLGQLSDAESAGQVVVWVNTVPWVGPATSGVDWWGGFSTQRTEIANAIAANGWGSRMCILSGDMHAMAFDDGTNSSAGIPVIQAAPLDRTNFTSPNTYSAGPPVTASESQYGLLDVTDTGVGSVGIRYRGISVDTGTGAETVQIDETFNLSV